MPQKVLPFSLDLEGRVKWFVKLRWFVIMCITCAVVSSILLFHILPLETYIPLSVVVLFLMIYNTVLSVYPRLISNARLNIFLQAIIDLIILTLLLHFSGGLDNPFFFMYLFHPLLAWLLLPERESYAITIITCCLFFILAFGELTGVFKHYLLKVSLYNFGGVTLAYVPSFVVTISIIFLLLILGTNIFSASVIRELKNVNRRTIQAGKMAAIGELAGSIAHEVNNPIGIISTKAKLILSEFTNGELPVKVLSDIKKIDKHADRITNLVKGLLAFSRPSLGQKSEMDVNQVVKQSVDLVYHRLLTQNIKCNINLYPGYLNIKGNFNELQQIIINLINNAIDAMQNGGELFIKSYMNKSYAYISVKDTGVGISEDIITKIYDPFFTTKPETKGTGLGLSISIGLAKSHGGSIDVISKLGKGAEFILSVPLLSYETK